MTVPPRWAQLTYTTFDSEGAASSGWQVKQETVGLSDTEREVLLDCVSTSLDPPRQTSRFLSEAEVAQLPRRLVLARVGTGGVLMHSSPAGSDSFGRPGNVFNHGLLDRDMTTALSAPGAMRPLQWWRSPEWLTPFGPAQVRAAVFDDSAPPAAAVSVSRRDAVALLLDHDPNVRTTTRMLLDACAAAIDGGPPVAVVAPSVDEGVRWLAAVAFLSAPQANVRLTFSTYERARATLAQGSSSLLNVLLTADLEGQTVRSPQVVVIDPEAGPERVGSGVEARWRNRFGQEVPVSSWSRLVDAVCELGWDETMRTLEAIDEISALNPEPAEACPWWPLAVSVGENDALEAAWDEATSVMLATPSTAELDEDTQALLVDLHERASGSTREEAHTLLAKLASANPDSSLLSSSYRRYLERTVADPASLSTAAPLPLPQLPPRTRERVLADLVPFIEETLESKGSQPMRDETWCVDALRFLALLHESGLPVVELTQRPSRSLERIAQVLAYPMLGDRTAEALVDLPLPVRRVAASCLGQPFAAYGRIPGQRLSDVVAEWLAAAYETEDLCIDVATGTPPVEPIRQELAVRRTVQLMDRAPERLRLAAAVALLTSEAWLPGAPPSSRIIRALEWLGGSLDTWPPSHVRYLLVQFPQAPILDFAAVVQHSILTFAPDAGSAELAKTALADTQARDTLSSVSVALLHLTGLVQYDWWTTATPTYAAQLLVTAARTGLVAGHPYLDRMAPHLLLAALLVERDVRKVSADWREAMRREVPKRLSAELVQPALADPAFFDDALAMHNWRLASYLFLRASEHEVRGDGPQRTRASLVDLGVLFGSAEAEVAPELAPNLDRDLGAPPLVDDYFVKTAAPARARASTAAGTLLVPFLQEHDSDVLQDLLAKSLDFSSSELRKTWQWVNETLRSAEADPGRRRRRTKTEGTRWR